jgi:hypothetical protein
MRLECLSQVAQERHAVLFFYFLIGVDNEHGIQSTAGQIGRAALPEPSFDVLESFPAHATANGFEHLALYVLGVHHAVWSNASSQLDREPA